MHMAVYKKLAAWKHLFKRDLSAKTCTILSCSSLARARAEARVDLMQYPPTGSQLRLYDSLPGER